MNSSLGPLLNLINSISYLIRQTMMLYITAKKDHSRTVPSNFGLLQACPFREHLSVNVPYIGQLSVAAILKEKKHVTYLHYI